MSILQRDAMRCQTRPPLARRQKIHASPCIPSVRKKVTEQMNKIDEELKLLGGLDDNELSDLKEEDSPEEVKLSESSIVASMKTEGDKNDADNTKEELVKASKNNGDMVVDAVGEIQSKYSNDWASMSLEEIRQAIPDMTLDQRRQIFQVKEKQMRQDFNMRKGKLVENENEAEKVECNGDDSADDITDDIWELRKLVIPEDVSDDLENDKTTVKQLQQTVKEMNKKIRDVQKEIKDTRESNRAMLQRNLDARLDLSEVQMIQIPSKDA